MLNVLEFKTQIQTNELGNFYILTGDLGMIDVYIENIPKSVKRYDSVLDILNSSGAGGFFSESTCYVVHNDKQFEKAEKDWDTVISGLGEDTLILILDNVDKRGKLYKKYKDRIVEFERMSDELIVDNLYMVGYKLAPPQYNHIIGCCNGNWGRIVNELDKLKYISDNQIQAFDRLRMSGQFHRDAESVSDIMFAVANMVCQGDIMNSVRYIKIHKALLNNNIVGFIAILYNNLKQIYQVQLAPTNTERVTGLTRWQIDMARKYIGVYSTDALESILQVLRDAEIDVKTGRIPKGLILENIITTIGILKGSRGGSL